MSKNDFYGRIGRGSHTCFGLKRQYFLRLFIVHQGEVLPLLQASDGLSRLIDHDHVERYAVIVSLEAAGTDLEIATAPLVHCAAQIHKKAKKQK